jgi:hypothetical protein
VGARAIGPTFLPPKEEVVIRICETCRHFRETAAKPTQASRGACAWLPKWRPVSRQHDCGQWARKQEDQ